jgi:hypothetical protein
MPSCCASWIVDGASGGGNVWVNDSGRSDGVWTEYQTPLRGGYSRNLQYAKGTGRVVILQPSWGGAGIQATIRHGEVDLGNSAGTYYRLVNRTTNQVIGTGNNTNEANIGNSNVPDVVMENSGAAQNPDTQYWHVVTKADGNETLLNKSGGREAAVWTGNATVGVSGSASGSTTGPRARGTSLITAMAITGSNPRKTQTCT